MSIDTPHLSSLRESSEGDTPNGRARMLVLKSIAFSPQDNEGSPYLIADKILQRMEKPEAVSIIDMANIQPDMVYDAEFVKFVHLQNGINFAPSPERVCAFMHGFAIMAIENIRHSFLLHAPTVGIDIPEDLQEAIATYKPDGYLDPNPFQIHQERVTLLQDILLQHPTVTALIATDIHQRAQEVRKDAFYQRRSSAFRGSLKYPLHNTIS